MEEGKATHSSILFRRIPWTEESDGATIHRVSESDTTEVTLHAHTHDQSIDKTDSGLCAMPPGKLKVRNESTSLMDLISFIEPGTVPDTELKLNKYLSN